MKMKFLSRVFLIALFFISCSKQKIEKYEDSRFLFGTYIKIITYEKNKNLAQKSLNKAFEEIERIDKKFNSKYEGSIFYKLNASNNKEVELDYEGMGILKKVKEAYELSNKKYDITISPLLDLWGFTEEQIDSTSLKIPTKKEIEFTKKFIDFEKVKFGNNKIKLEEGIKKIDTGSFLKGYAISQAKEVLKASGIKSAFITSISSIEVLGTKPQGREWKIGLQNPENLNELIGVVSLKDKALGVSGDYQTYIEIDGKKYHHILDKESGYPVRDKKMVVVIAGDSFKADLYSTAFFLMPIQKVIQLVDNTEDLEVLIVDKNMKIIKSKNFKLEEIKK